MAAVIGALRVELSASIAKWQDDLGKASKSLEGFKRNAQAIASQMQSVGIAMSVAITAPMLLLGKAALAEARDAREAQAQLQAALKSTGGAAGKSAEGLQKAAKELQNISTYDDDDILRNVTTNLLTFGNVTGQVFDRAQLAILNLSARLGGDLQGATLKVGRALNDPIQGIAALSRVGVQFTTDQKEQIKALVQNGKGMEAQGMILDALAAKFGGAAKAMRDADPSAVSRQAWRDFQETIGDVELNVLPTLANALKSVLDLFLNLSPTTQKWVVIVAGVAAVLGPVILGISTLITGLFALAPLVAAATVALAPFAIAIGGTVAVVAGCAAAVYLLYQYWGALTDLLSGNFTSAWAKAKAATADMTKQLKSGFGLGGNTKPATAAAGVPGALTGKAGGTSGFDLHNEDDIKKTAAATETLGKQIDTVQLKLAHGLDDLALPKSVASANALNAQVDEYVKTAREAGVNTDKFAGRIAALRDNIENLKAAGLVKEAQAFTREVDKSAISVRRFASGELPPLDEALAGIDEQYNSLHDQIQQQIEDNTALAGVNDSARAAMERLQGQLKDLETAHDKAAQAARAHYHFEELLSDLNSKQNEANTRADIQDFQKATGKGGPVGAAQAEMQRISRDLVQYQSDSLAKLIRLEDERNQEAEKGNDAGVARLEREITLQSQLLDLVESTSADQLYAAQRINDAFDQAADSISDKLSDMIMNWDGSLKGLMDTFKQLANQLFVKPFTDQIGSGVSGFLKGALGKITGSGGDISPVSVTPDIFGNGGFAGAFAGGGSIDPGKWGIVGENGPEVAYGGNSGLDIYPNGSRPGMTVIQNISTPDPGAFRRSSRQIANEAKKSLARA